MYRVALCGDEAVFSQAQEKICRDILEKLEMESDITVFSGNAELLRAFFEQGLRPDLILLDILLPDGSGLDYCREVFGQTAPRILFLSAMNTPEDVIAGLRAGGDDYMTKPYLMQELVARIEAILRRAHIRVPEPQTLRIGSLELNSAAGRAYLNGEDLLLTHMEYALLEYLARNTDKYLLTAELYRKLWDMDAVGDVRTVWEHISRLRKKLAPGGVNIQSVRGKGYRLLAKTANLAKN